MLLELIVAGVTVTSLAHTLARAWLENRKHAREEETARQLVVEPLVQPKPKPLTRVVSYGDGTCKCPGCGVGDCALCYSDSTRKCPGCSVRSCTLSYNSEEGVMYACCSQCDYYGPVLTQG